MLKNPVDAGKQEEIRRITQRVLERFIKNYGTAIKEVCLEKAEARAAKEERKRAAKEEKREEKESAVQHTPNKPLRPRKEYAPETPNKEQLVCTVTNWETLDSDVDPYVGYIITSSYAGMEATKSRRYKEFKELHKKIKKLEPKDAKLPKASSKFGSRNLKYDFIDARKKALQAYLDKVCAACPDNEHLKKFLGLVEVKDPEAEEMFCRAVKKTKWDLWIWRRIAWDTHDEAIAALIIEEIRRDMWADITRSLPPSEMARKKVMQLVYKAIRAIVTPAVGAAWPPAEKAAEPARAKVVEVINKILKEVVQKKLEVKDKLKDGMKAVLSPLTEVMAAVISKVLQAVLPPAIGALGVVSNKLAPLDAQIVESLTSSDEEKVKSATTFMTDVKREVATKAAEAVVKALGAVVTEISSGISVDVLKPLLAPLGEGFAGVLSSVTDVIDPKYWTDPVLKLYRYKEEILKNMDFAGGKATPESVNAKLDWEEYDVMWWVRWWGYDVRANGRRLWWELSTSPLGSSIGPIPDVFWDLAVDVQRRLHKRVLKKMCFKFGDYLWGFMNDANDNRPWAEKVNAAFVEGYRRGLKCARKQAVAILVQYATDFVKRPVLGPIEQHVVPKIQDLISPIESTLPEPIKEVLDISGLVGSAILESVAEACDQVVLAQAPVASAEMAKVFPPGAAAATPTVTAAPAQAPPAPAAPEATPN